MPPSVLILEIQKSWLMPLLTVKFFPFGDYENGRCNIFGFPSLKLWRMPKTRNAPIPNSDGGSRVKEVHA
jgi:hypothetical protein